MFRIYDNLNDMFDIQFLNNVLKNRERVLIELQSIHIYDKYKVKICPVNEFLIHSDCYKTREACSYPVCDMV